MQRPYGFIFSPEGRLWRDPDEQAVIERAYSLRLQHYTLRDIASILTQEGHRNRAGGRFYGTQVHRMLRGRAAAASSGGR